MSTPNLCWKRPRGTWKGASLVGAGSLLVLTAPLLPAVLSFATVRNGSLCRGGLVQATQHGSPAAPSAVAVDERAAPWIGGASACGILALAGVILVSQRPKALGIRAQRLARLQRHGWGDDVVFHQACVNSNTSAAEGLRLITVQVPNDVSGSYSTPGQFVQAKPSADAKPSFYAISNAPQKGEASDDFEFLIKEAESNEWLTGAKSGDFIQLSSAMGRGFNLECEAWKDAEVSQVGLFATGSGIAPIRAVIESDALENKVARLYLGARSEASLPFADRIPTWREDGVEVVVALSQAKDGWEGRRGYVQAAFEEDEGRGEGFVLRDRHGALLCGQKDMVNAVKDVYKGLDVPEERLLLNF